MLVIGFRDGENFTYSHTLDMDPDVDSPRKIHDALKKAANGIDFSTIVCVIDDEVVGTFVDGEDYDLTDEAEEEEELPDDEEDIDDDNLHDVDEDDDE
jgi:hypothetical protein